MRRRLRSCLDRQSSGLLPLLVLLLIACPAAAGEPFQGKVGGVTDGDTIQVLRDGRAVSVRLNGIDAPEGGQAFGNRARQFAASLVFEQLVTVFEHGTDHYGRTIADVFLPDGRVLNRELVRAGYA